MTPCLRQRKEDQTLIYFCPRPSIMGNATPENLVGEGFPPRSCASAALRKSHGGKGEG